MALGRREGSNTSACHYLDGMPVKISEKFKPPRKITLPLSYQQHYPVNLLNEEYDFSLENQVLELAMTKRRGKEVAQRAKMEKVGNSIEQFTRLVSGEHRGCDNWEKKDCDSNKAYPGANKVNGDGPYASNDSNGNTQEAGDTHNGPAVGIATSLLTSLEPNSMLKPVVSSTEPPTVSDKPDVTLTSKFNLEDFESESSPFDSVELKTLNDIEELKSVLQNANLSESGNGDRHTEHGSQTTVAKESARISTYSGRGEEYQGLEPTIKSHTGRPLSSADSPSILSTVSQSGNIPHSKYPGFALESASYPPPCGGGMATPCGPMQPLNGDTPLASKDSPEEDIYACVIPLLNSRSTPDLLRELGVALASEREKKKNLPSSFQPKRSGALGSLNATASETTDNSSIANKDLEMNVDDGSKNSYARPSSQNSISELDAEAQQLIGHITDMGFPKAKVSRMVQHVGKDDKKVVEHLCLMQTFIERGYIADDVEAGVLLYGNNETQVKEYLETMIQFRDLGFDNESINKALVQCEHDREKALDLLLLLSS